jgi:hypothetical protein
VVSRSIVDDEEEGGLEIPEAYNEDVKKSVQSSGSSFDYSTTGRIFKEERLYYKLTTSVDGEV